MKPDVSINKIQDGRLIMNSITSTYKKTNNNIKKQINMAVRNIMRDKELIKRMETNEEGNSFITIKDRKENFDKRPTVRLINPVKNELGRINKLILDKINKKNQSMESMEKYRCSN